MRIIYLLIICSLASVLCCLGIYKKISRKTAAYKRCSQPCACRRVALARRTSGQQLLRQGYNTCGNTHGRKLIALTFDDGPYPPIPRSCSSFWLPNVHATFFMVGENAAKHPETVKLVQAQGHLIALHAGYHKDLLKLSSSEAAANIAYGKETLQSITGTAPQYMRPPHGFKDWSTVKAINDAGMQIVNWSIIPRDWTNPGVQVIADRVCENAAPGAIVLLHDGDSPKNLAPRDQTIEAVGLIIDVCVQRDMNLSPSKNLINNKGATI